MAFAAAIPCAYLLSLCLSDGQPLHMLAHTVVWSAAAGAMTFLLLTHGLKAHRHRPIGPLAAATIGWMVFAAITLLASAIQALATRSLEGGLGVLLPGLLVAWYPPAVGALVGLLNRRIARRSKESAPAAHESD